LLQPENIASIPALRPLVQNKIMQALLPKWQPEPFGVPCQGGWLSSLYGWKDGRWYFHNGIDIALEQGTEVIASTSGRVSMQTATFSFHFANFPVRMMDLMF
jgi:murein DD-endopeptidase MepM/ murein hydrolase activator NlpD